LILIIRKAILEDLPSIRALEQQSDNAAHWGEREYEALFAADAPQRLVLVAADQPESQQIAGFAVARCALDEWDVENVVVHGQRRRTGIGSSLVRKLLLEARGSGASAVFLEVRESNSAARKLYENIGFSEIGRREDYYSVPVEDALIFRFSIAIL
jgi:ribosomal-protein-alanine acetyltransferase